MIFPVMLPKWDLPKKRGQATAFSTAKNPPKIPKPAINIGTPAEVDKNKKPNEAKNPPKSIKYKYSFNGK